MNKAITTIGVVGVLTYCLPVMPASATSTKCSYMHIQYSDTVQPYAEGLIYKYELSVSCVNGMLSINGKTKSNSIMKHIGYKDIKIEYSSNGNTWYEEKSLDDMLKSDSSSYNLSSYTVSVKGGYYYRITCNHYAKEKGLFGSSQTVANTSNSVWID
ncbi:MAG: hypothetical protein K2N49_02685 [Ruminococcus sp.]|nr:hypothetical protein [Ruminococcus sp.]MDE7225752.1 hypothetical protein [Ruminococcus sp.]